MDVRDIARVFENLPGNFAVLRAEPGFPVVAMSRALRRASLDPDHALGRPVFGLFPESAEAAGGVAQLAASFERVIRTKARERQELRFDVRDPASGGFVERYWVTTCSPVLDAAGDVEYLVYQADDAAIERSRGSMAILDAMTEGVFTLDRKWRFGYVNPEANRMLGETPGALLGQVIWDKYPGTEQSEFGEHYRRAMATREASRFSAFYPGLERWYEVTAYPAPEGISVYFRDITAAVLAEQETRRLAEVSERQRRIYETALDNTPDFVYVFDTDHRAVYANEALRTVWGVADVSGKTWMELGYEQWHADLHDRELAQVISTGLPIRGEIPFTGTNGRRIYDYIFAPVLDPTGTVVAVAGTTRDVTERHATEQLVREHADRMAEADRAKDEFLATLSHELRNPLAPLRNGLEILRRTTSDGAPGASIHSMMERQVDHLVRLVDDLMEVSRITRGKVSLQVEPVDFRQVVQSAIDAARPAIEAGGHRLTVDLPDAPIVLHGDRVRLAQVLGNLLNNAAKYSGPGSDIELTVSSEAGALVARVRDTGIGMDPEEIPRLFGMFTRGERVGSTHQSGLGIGLALARSLAALHGGSLAASSDGPGQGSTFELRLPLPDGVVPAIEHTSAPEDARLSLRVLIADDQPDVGHSLGEVLRLHGVEVHVVADGAAALDSFDRIRPDVAILDIGMPEVSGHDVARVLRARGVTVPLLALTGWGQATDREQALAAGFTHHLVKPVAPGLLVDLLRSLEPR